MEIELVFDARATIGESLLWVAEENSLYWADIKAPSLHRTRLDTLATQSWKLPADIGGFTLDGSGRALVALRTGLYWLDLKSGGLRLQEEAPFDPRILRFNEGACDSAGRFWVGIMADPVDGSETKETGKLYSFTSRDGLTAHDDICALLNGMAWNADETVFYLSHSYEQRIFAFDYDKRSGVLQGRRDFVRLEDDEGIPDGAAMDTDGCYWCAIHGGGRLHRYGPGGKLEEIIPLPVSQPTMCCFAGKNLDQLYITSAREKLSAAQLEKEPHAGGLFRMRPGVTGVPRYTRVI